MEIYMFPGHTQYREGQFEPERGASHNWHVWCMTGALKVLRTRGYITYLAENAKEVYTINFANGSAARIAPGHELWKELAAIAQTYNVRVYRLDDEQLLRSMDWCAGRSFRFRRN